MHKAFAQAKKSEFTTPAAYQTFLTETGQTQADIQFRVRVNQIYKDLLSRDTRRSRRPRSRQYFSGHPTQFGTPGGAGHPDRPDQHQGAGGPALAALKAGQSWDTVAKKYSVDSATKNNGGQLTDITKGQEEHALNQVAFSTPLNTLQGPVSGTFGWYVVVVTSKIRRVPTSR